MIRKKETRLFRDGITDIASSITNTRNALRNNVTLSETMNPSEMVGLYKSGIGNKIIRLKSGYALDDTLGFESSSDETIYNSKLATKTKEAVKWMLVFGRSIMVFHDKGDDLSKPKSKFSATSKVSVFSGDMVTVHSVSLDLQDDMYLKPLYYNVRGVTIHHSRVVDFTYVRPTELELPVYQFGGISEFELIRDQLTADGIMARAATNMIEKSSSLFYKVEGFSDLVMEKKDSAIVNYFTAIENMRSINGAGILDSKDDVISISQAIGNLAETDLLTLRRISMVTGIALTVLVGEPPKGLNSSGDNEMQSTYQTIRALQSDYLLEPISKIMDMLGLGDVAFVENQGQSPMDSAKYDQLVIDNAVKLASIGEDHENYLSGKNVIQLEDFTSFFEGDDPFRAEATGESSESNTSSNIDPEGVDPQSALNGAQVTAMLEIFERVANGMITKNTAARLIATAFPVSIGEAQALVSELEVKSPIENPLGGGINGQEA